MGIRRDGWFLCFLCILLGWAIMIFVAFVLLFLFSGTAEADNLPVAKVGNLYKFESHDSAARAALKAAVRVSKQYEVGGLVIQCGEWFAYTDPVTNRSTVRVHYRYEFPSECKIAALYHTHPHGEDAKLLSPTDQRNILTLKVPSYILAVKDRQVVTYEF